MLSIGSSTLNLTNAGGMTIGTYTLFDYGVLIGDVANLGTPVGPSQFKYTLEDSGSEIDLTVSMFGDFNGDGSVDAADYNVWRKGMGTIYTAGRLRGVARHIMAKRQQAFPPRRGPVAPCLSLPRSYWSRCVCCHFAGCAVGPNLRGKQRLSTLGSAAQ